MTAQNIHARVNTSTVEPRLVDTPEVHRHHDNVDTFKCPNDQLAYVNLPLECENPYNLATFLVPKGVHII